MTNKAALFLRSIQCSSLAVMVMVFSMNPSIDDSVAVMSNARGSTLRYGFLAVVYPTLVVRICVVS